MARDLGTTGSQVHQEAEAVLHFWLAEVPPEKRFARDDALDAECAARFGALRDAVVAGHASGWRRSPRPLLAAIVLIDQFSRNIFRGSAQAFAADPLARALAGEALAKGWADRFTAEERQFLWMPFMHAEHLDTQVRAQALFASVGADAAAFARAHAAQIARFGRFPQRNSALDRATTAAEEAFIANPANHF
ncbi:DUF924 domain-containing protein [Sphingomonas naphthae]|uniref:DUF924 domain-containing protein n=1 Tax=Sphingomonas naphthae TaxID=1813468 RepID=A0ABY7TN00_9SPHN|nr:DUF924 family protein [Sphingomonas naphthae]WCT74325.1 DUF924 domain-containing protein [Sphingomonas naphthae]